MAILWDKAVCGGCPLRQRCLPPGQDQRTLLLSRYYDLLSARRREQKTPEFGERYRRRAGIEATFSHLVNVHGARRTPCRGPDKTLGYYAALCVGVNLRRIAAWQAGDLPQRERRSRLSGAATASASRAWRIVWATSSKRLSARIPPPGGDRGDVLASGDCPSVSDVRV